MVNPIRALFHPGKEWDDYTKSWVRKGWIAERQGYHDQALAEWQERVATGRLDQRSICTSCGLMIDLHPHPERTWRNTPDLCAVARAKAHGYDGDRPGKLEP